MIVAGVAVAVFGGGWAAAAAVQSPAQREAAATAPEKIPVTAAVTRGDLADTVTSEVEVRRAERQRLALTTAETPAVVTRVPVPAGHRVGAGTVLLEINGRPVIALPGAFRFYRDLEFGQSGPDVRQLQEGLTAAGFGAPADGLFGAQTERAVRELYREVGYAVHESADKPEKDDDEPVAHAMVPGAELTVMATPEAFLVAGPAVGAEVDADSTVVVERGGQIAVAVVPTTVAVRVATGMRGTISTAGRDVAVSVSAIREGESDGESTIHLTPRAARSVLPTGASSLLRLDVDVVERDSLLVPTRAVVTGGSATAHVRKRLADGSFVEVPVRETGQLNGQSAVAPAANGSLATGDLVRVD